MRTMPSSGCKPLTLWRAIFAVVFWPILCHSFAIEPGVGLCQLRGGFQQVVIFEHTEMGTGGLVLNCPTPLSLGNIPIPRFSPYKDLPLMLGCGYDAPDENDECSVALSDLSPWFWLHDVPGIPGSYELTGAAGPLYMGGDMESLSNYLISQDPRGRIKFFRKYKLWKQGQLEQEIQAGKWEVHAQDPKQALRLIESGIKL